MWNPARCWQDRLRGDIERGTKGIGLGQGTDRREYKTHRKKLTCYWLCFNQYCWNTACIGRTYKLLVMFQTVLLKYCLV